MRSAESADIWRLELGLRLFFEEQLLFLEQLLRVARRLWGTGLLPNPPNGNIAEAERVPPEIEHALIEIEYSRASDTRWRRNKRGETRVNLGALRAGGAREKMPERQCILCPCFRENAGERGAAGGRILRIGIELRDGFAESRRCVLEIRNSGAEFAACGAHGSGRDERVTPI